MSSLNPDKALIFRIMHVANLPWILDHGLHCRNAAAFSNSLTDLPSLIDWPLIRSRDFRRDPENPERFERYQAEALVHRHLPVTGLLGLACQNPAVGGRIQAELDSRGIQLKIAIKPDWYFR